MRAPVYSLLGLLSLVLFASSVHAQTPVASVRSGNWSDPAMWSTGRAPGTGDAVTVSSSHTVYLDVGADTVAALNVAQGAAVRRAEGPSGLWALAVTGAIVNRGTVHVGSENNACCSQLAVHVGGDLTNNGRWEPAETRFTGTSTHTVQGDSALGGTLVVDAVAGGTPGEVVLGSDVRLNGYLRLGTSLLRLGVQTLTVQGGVNATAIEGGRVVSDGGTVHFLTGPNVSASLWSVRFDGPVTLSGVLRVGLDVVVNGVLTIAQGATIRRVEGPSGLWPLVVNGSVVNRGTVHVGSENNACCSHLAVHVGGDLTNNGRWEPAETRFTGTSTHTLRADSALGGTLVVDAVAGGTPGEVVLGSDVRLNGYLRLGDGLLRLGVHTLSVEGGSRYTAVEGGRIASDGGTVRFLAGQNSPASLWGVRFAGAVTLGGPLFVGLDIVVDGTLTLAPDAVMRRVEGASGLWPVVVNGSVINQGSVFVGSYNNPCCSQLAVHIGRSLTNTGYWEPAVTRFVGPGLHGIVSPNHRLGGSLELESPATPLAEVRFTRPFGGVVTRDFLLAEASASGTGLDSVRIVGAGNAPPSTFGNAVARTWGFEPFPASARVAFTRLTLRYTDVALGSSAEDSLQVYHSDDGGATWTRLSTASNLTRNAEANTVSLVNAPAYGMYALSARPIATSARSNVVFVVTGPERLRVGPPNRYLLTYTNLGSAPTGEFLAGLTTTNGIYVEEVVPSPERPGDAPRPLRKANFSHRSDSTHAVFYVPNLQPGEERTLVAIVRARADIQGAAHGEVPVFTDTDAYVQARASGMIAPALLWGGAVAAGAGASFVKDLWKETFTEMVNNPEDARNAPDRAFGKVANDWAGGFEKGMGELTGALQGELAGLAGKGTALDRANTLKDVADFAGALADANAEREERWRRADEGGPFGPGGNSGLGPFRVPVDYPDLPSAPAATPSPVRSWDPNEKIGPRGLGDAGFVTRFGRIPYVIRFENKKEATDAAYEIVIVDTLEADLDPETVINGATSHPIFRFTRTGNVLTWRATGIELPPNVNAPEGEGFVSFTVAARPGLPSGTRIENRATITFDLNAPIVTNTHVNTLDLSAPVTTMAALPAETTTPRLMLRWTARDSVGAGGGTTTVYASRDGGAFLPIGIAQGDSLLVDGVKGVTFRFYALTTDALGNAEQTRPALVETRFLTDTATDDAPRADAFALHAVYPNPSRGVVTVRFAVVSPEPVRLAVYDLLGRQVARIADGVLAPGQHEAVWDGRAVASGVYVVQLEQGRQRQSLRAVVAR